MARDPEREDPLHQDDVPGALDNASGEVDELEASIIRDGDASAGVSDEELARQAGASGPPARRDRAEAASGGRGPGRFVAFLKSSWAELKRVQWPDRRQVGQATAVVLGFVVVAGAYLGLADFVAQRVVDLII